MISQLELLRELLSAQHFLSGIISALVSPRTVKLIKFDTIIPQFPLVNTVQHQAIIWPLGCIILLANHR